MVADKANPLAIDYNYKNNTVRHLIHRNHKVHLIHNVLFQIEVL